MDIKPSVVCPHRSDVDLWSLTGAALTLQIV